MWGLLRRKEEQRWLRREQLREAVRPRLRDALRELAPGEKILLFGSITRPNAFHARSDVDIAFVEEPRHSRYGLQAKLEEPLHHPVDLVVLSECRFREKIEREGEAWMT